MNDTRICHGFEAIAHQALDVFCSESGFWCAESQADRVRYESSTVFFEVGYSVNHDCEVFARIGRIGFPGQLVGQAAERLDFGLFLAVSDAVGYAGLCQTVPHAIAHSEEQVRWILSYFAAGLREHGRPLLASEAGAYERARELRFWHMPDFPPEALEAKEGSIIAPESIAQESPRRTNGCS